MTDSESAQEPAARQRLTNREAYAAMIQMVIQIENVSWTRLYNYLMGSSILVLAWATVYASALKSPWTTAVLFFLALVGALAGPAWASLGTRARGQLELVYQAARRLESNSSAWEPNVVNGDLPLSVVATARDSASIYSSNPFLLKWAPLSFTGLNIVFLLATACR